MALAFGAAHGLMAMETTYESLAENGYLTPVSLSESADADAEQSQLYQWEDGCLFSITERDEPGDLQSGGHGPHGRRDHL